MSKTGIILLDFWASPDCMRTKIALAEKGIQYETKPEDLWNKSSLLLEMNPVHKLVPVLIHDGEPVCESLNQVEYIDEVWKDRAPILPSDPHQRAQARFWAAYVHEKVSFEAGKKIWATKGEAQEAEKKELMQTLKVLESQLRDNRPYFAGDTFGYVDIALVPLYSWFHALESCGGFSIEAECPKLIAWAKRCLERKSVSESLPDSKKVYDQVLKLRKMVGVK